MPALTRWSAPEDDEPTCHDARPWHRAEVLDDDEPTLPRVTVPRRRPLPESVEFLSLPEGMTEAMLAPGTRPRSYVELRIWLVRLARELAKEYRQRYDAELRTNVGSIERMQRHLMGLIAPSASPDPQALAREIVRHGALLGEILARSLGATWVELSGELPAEWQMLVPPSTTTNPIARVSLFLREGMRGEDLVAFYLDLDTRVRSIRESGVEW